MWKLYNRTWHKVNVIMILLLLLLGTRQKFGFPGTEPACLHSVTDHVSSVEVGFSYVSSMFPSFPSPQPGNRWHHDLSCCSARTRIILSPWWIHSSMLRLFGTWLMVDWDSKVQDLRKKLPIIFPRKDKEPVDSPKEASLWASLLIRQSFLFAWMLTRSTHRKKCLCLLWVGS